MRRRSPLAIMLVSVALLMSFSVVVASNTNELPNQNPTQSNNLQSSFMNESEGETFTVTVDGTNLRFSLIQSSSRKEILSDSCGKINYSLITQSNGMVFSIQVILRGMSITPILSTSPKMVPTSMYASLMKAWE